MKIVFVSNYLNGHQTEFCQDMYKKENIEFTLLQTQQMDEERIKLGWKLDTAEYNYFKEYAAMSDIDIEDLFETADVIILGDSKIDILKYSLKKNVLILFYRERLFKEKRIFSRLRFIKFWYEYVFRYRKYETAVLCASAYASADFSKIKAFNNRKFKWGYFPQFIEYDINKLMNKKQNNAIAKILWVGRLIDWKCCVDVVELAKRLKEDNIEFRLNIVGTGVLEKEIGEYIKKLNLNDCVVLEGSCPQTQVRTYMEQSNILVITSNHKEGWGAVVNEAMNSGCTVIGSHAVGSVPFLIEHEKNGLIYKCRDIDDLYTCVRKCLDNPDFVEEMGYNAYFTIKNIWNADNASNKLIQLIKYLNKQEKALKSEKGPCSVASFLDDFWFGEIR